MEPRREFVGEAPVADVPHHLHLSKALQRAADRAADELEQGAEAWFDVRFEVRVRRVNPGWIDGYRAILTPKDG